MVTSNEKKLLELTFKEWEGIGTWYEYLAKDKIFKELKDIKTVLVAGLPQEYGVSTDMLLFAEKSKLTVIDDRKHKLNQFKKIAKSFGVASNVRIVYCKNLSKYPFKDDSFDLVSNTEAIQRVKNFRYMIKEMERVSKKHIILFIPNAYYYSHYIITKIKTFKMKKLVKACNYPIIEKDYLDSPPWPAGIAVSPSKISFTRGSRANERRQSARNKVKDSFFISIIKKIFLFFTPALVFLESLYFPPLKEFLSHMFYIHMVKK